MRCFTARCLRTIYLSKIFLLTLRRRRQPLPAGPPALLPRRPHLLSRAPIRYQPGQAATPMLGCPAAVQGCGPEIRPEYVDLFYVIGPDNPTLSHTPSFLWRLLHLRMTARAAHAVLTHAQTPPATLGVPPMHAGAGPALDRPWRFVLATA